MKTATGIIVSAVVGAIAGWILQPAHKPCPEAPFLVTPGLGAAAPNPGLPAYIMPTTLPEGGSVYIGSRIHGLGADVKAACYQRDGLKDDTCEPQIDGVGNVVVLFKKPFTGNVIVMEKRP